MNHATIRKIFVFLFLLFSIVVIIYGVMFVINQMISVKYYFDDALPNSINNFIPICKKDFFLELILYAKILIIYAICGLVLSIYCIKGKKRLD